MKYHSILGWLLGLGNAIATIFAFERIYGIALQMVKFYGYVYLPVTLNKSYLYLLIAYSVVQAIICWRIRAALLQQPGWNRQLQMALSSAVLFSAITLIAFVLSGKAVAIYR